MTQEETIKIVYTATPSHEELQILSDGISDYARQCKNQAPIQSFAYFVKDCNEVSVGGCNGSLYYGCLYIDQLWLDESRRGQGLGSQLVALAEQLGRENECLFATVNTMDWEALEFYKKLGYTVEFQREGYVNDSILYFLRKDLG